MTAGSDPVDAESWVVEPFRPGLLSRVRELWVYRRLFAYFVTDNVMGLYERMLLGKAWLFIRPLFPITIGAFVFGTLLNAPSAGVPYFLFFLVGFGIWNFFETCLMFMTKSLSGEGDLLNKLYFPRLLIPLASLAVPLLYLVIYGTLFVGTVAYYFWADDICYLKLRVETLASVAAVAICLVLAIGLGLWLSVVYIHARDTRFLLSYTLRFWFFVTPVVYPLAHIPEKWQWVIAVNPMTAVVETFKWGLLGTDSFNVQAAIISVCSSLAILVSGLWFFTRTEQSTMDQI